MTTHEAKDLLLSAVEHALSETTHSLAIDAEELKSYAILRALNLVEAFGKPGFFEALRAETDNVLLQATRSALRASDAADARAWGIVNGALLILAKVLVA